MLPVGDLAMAHARRYEGSNCTSPLPNRGRHLCHGMTTVRRGNVPKKEKEKLRKTKKEKEYDLRPVVCKATLIVRLVASLPISPEGANERVVDSVWDVLVNPGALPLVVFPAFVSWG
jgi:hypothetical protein